MKILIAGATGFVGRALCLRLQQDGHEITALSRTPARAQELLGRSVHAMTLDELRAEPHRFSFDVAINLVGEPVLGRRWTSSFKKELRASRVDYTEELVRTLSQLAAPPRAFVSSSAVGIYGATSPGQRSDEGAAPGEDFLARLCVAWEGAARRAESFGCRVALIRIGIVLGKEGGALEKMAPPFRLGIGGRLGSGEQMMSWIHLHDLVDIFAAAVQDEELHGPINAVAPRPVSNREFTKALADTLRRPAVLPVPSWGLKALVGQGARVLLGGQEVVPALLARRGFRFRFPRVDDALYDILRDEDSCRIQRVAKDSVPNSSYLRDRKATYELCQETVIDAPIDEVREFFSRAENLGILTPPSVDFHITSEPIDEMKAGVSISYRIKIGPIPINWRTEIERYDEAGFVDVQMRGPYRAWWHEHRFREVGNKTIMNDRVLYSLPLGPLGRIVHAIQVKKMLRGIFSYRSRAIAFRFGIPGERRAMEVGNFAKSKMEALNQ